MRRRNANLRSIGLRSVEGLEVSRKPECSRARQQTVQALPRRPTIGSTTTGHCQGRQTKKQEASLANPCPIAAPLACSFTLSSSIWGSRIQGRRPMCYNLRNLDLPAPEIVRGPGPRASLGAGRWLGLTPWGTYTSCLLPAWPGALRLWVNRVRRIYLIDRRTLAYLGEICALDDESGSGG
jgi:hypothetical protein